MKRLTATAMLLFACSKPVDHAKIAAAVANLQLRAGLALASCDFKVSCDRSEYDPAMREVEDLVLGIPSLKNAVAEFGIATDLALASQRHAEYVRFREASLRLDNALKAVR